MKHISDDVKDIAMEIGIFFLIKNNGNYKITWEKIKELGITKIEICEYVIKIHLHRPGLLIGLKGETIEALAKHLNKNRRDIKIVEEYNINDYIMPHNPHGVELDA